MTKMTIFPTHLSMPNEAEGYIFPENNYKYCETLNFIEGKLYSDSVVGEPVVIFDTNKMVFIG